MTQLKDLIDESNLPKPYGGELPWHFEDDPLLDDEIRDSITQMPQGPAIFRDGNCILGESLRVDSI